MAERKNLDGLSLSVHRGITIMDLGSMEIWDGADLSLLRDGLNHVILQRGCRSVAVDMSAVKYVPSGFFGMLFDWFEQGVNIRLFAPLDRIRNMIWFRQFFSAESDAWYVLHEGLTESPRESEKTDEWAAASDVHEDRWADRTQTPTPVTANR